MRARRGAALAVVAFVVFTALVLAFTVTGSRVSTLASSLAKIVDFTNVLQADVKSANLAALSSDLVTLNDLTHDTLVAASDPVLSAALGGVPVASRHLDAARSLAAAAAGLTSASLPLAHLLPQLQPSALVSGGRYNVAALSQLDTVMKDLDAQLAVSSKQIAGIDTTGLDSRFVSVITKIGPILTDAQSLIDQLEPLVSVLPIVLDSTQQRTWFVALQNLTEARATGGLLGAYAVLDVNNGAIHMAASGSDNDLIPVPVTYTGLSDDFVNIWQTNANEWRSINVSPHFPDTGQLISNIWEKHTGQKIDGVLAFGQGIVQYMLAATGPVTIDGTTVDATNVIKFLSLGVYDKYPDAKDKNAFVAKLVADLFSKLQAGQFDLESLLSATGATKTTDRLLAWSPDAAVEQRIVGAGIDGSLPSTPGPIAAVAINNGGGNKLEQFLATKIDYTLGACTAPASAHSRAATMTITLTNNAPKSGLPTYVSPRLDDSADAAKHPVGSNLEIVSVYLPVNAEDGDSTVDGEYNFGYQGVERDKPLLVFAVELAPGQTSTIVVPWVEPTVAADGISPVGVQPQVLTQPSLNPIIVTAPAAAKCS